MCTDFTDLNKAFPKDPYPLPWVDLLVDSTAGCALFNMMDNACAIYQRLINKTFRDLIGKIIEVYVDDMLVKSKEEEKYVNHLQATIEVVRKYGTQKMIKEVQKLRGVLASFMRPETVPDDPTIVAKSQDGSSTSRVGGVGILLQGPGGVEIKISTKLDFPTTNNEVEYEALTLSLEMVLDAGVK
ncbi:hypothetical protein Sango_0361700 [Sesamum angolense]|uniref:Gag-pol polyprotein n=1 Tax=Sesamum angolense TaxID=2727404 RepID=A0AAE2C3L2_9LAMI|nr:hypothetical protein Sango_0361700 [Sesamum angolense]